MKVLLSGNEAVARGAYEAGVRVATAYPGTPSTEILENIARYDEIYAQWSVNEKVAFEVAIGASMAGVRALVAMKHVGLNVAADPLMTASYVGCRGGLVLVSADDPGMHSSQNEQDNRAYAKMAKIPMLEPSDSQEAKDFVVRAFQISEEFDTPVMVRMTTRICHGKSPVVEAEPQQVAPKGYEKDVKKYVMIPGHARLRHVAVEERRLKLEQYTERFEHNAIEMNDPCLGIISSGVAFQYAREAFPEASVLKLGMTHPLPSKMIGDFAGRVEKLYAVEELEPYLEDQIKALGIPVVGKEVLPRVGELSPEIVRDAIGAVKTNRAAQGDAADLPARPPAMCPGCPHRGLFYVLWRLKLTVTGDIGCYTLSVLPPLQTMDLCICMGASIGTALGMEKALGPEASEHTVAVLGDSTFIHSGITGLVDVVYNRSNVTVIVLDNRTTAMTGHQENPGTGRTLKGERTHPFDFVAVGKAIGIDNPRVVDPYDLEATEQVVREEVARRGPSLIVSRRECVLLVRDRARLSRVDAELCVGCKLCLRLGCPALSMSDEMAVIDPLLCFGCGVCAQVCSKGAVFIEDRM